MSAIEKMCLFVLALDRIAKHGNYYLPEEIDTPRIRLLISLLSSHIQSIPDWDSYAEKQSEWWVDLRDTYVNLPWTQIKGYKEEIKEKCTRCHEMPAIRWATVKKKKLFVCRSCFYDWKRIGFRLFKESWNENFTKFIEDTP